MPENARSHLQDYTTTVTILESMTDAIFILDSQGVVKYANHAASLMLQQPAQEVMGQALQHYLEGTDQLPPTDAPSSRSDLQLLDGASRTFQTPNGGIPVLLSVSQIPSQDLISYFIVTAKETGYSQSLDRELKQRQALSISLDKLKSLGEMSVGLVHTLGQPMTAMELRLSKIEKASAEAAIHAEVNAIRKDMDVLRSIVDQIRNYALFSEGRGQHPVALNELLRSTVPLFEYDLAKVGVKYELVLADDLPQIMANTPELQQVIIELVGNAMEAFKDADGSDPKLLLETATEAGKWVSLSVEDNAGGIDEQILEHIYDPFFTTRDDEEHAGTGLAVAKSILTSLGGELRHESIQGGSRFILKIPLLQNDEREQLFNLIELLHSD